MSKNRVYWVVSCNKTFQGELMSNDLFRKRKLAKKGIKECIYKPNRTGWVNVFGCKKCTAQIHRIVRKEK